MSSPPDDDLLAFCEEEESAPAGTPAGEPWRVLLVDDDAQVLIVSRLAFANVEVDGRRVELLGASSGREARALLEAHDDIALGVFDVVMEEDDAGLALVAWARAQERLRCMRIILRTGQPGSAPEETVLRVWDINDYWPKTELTAHRMRTLLTGQLRSYRDLRTIERQRDDLGRVVAALGGLIGLNGLRAVLEGLVAQLRTAISAEHALLAIFDVRDPGMEELNLLVSTGDSPGSPLPEQARTLLTQSRASGRMAVEGTNLALFCASGGPRGAAFWASGVGRMDGWTEHTLELFSRNALGVLNAQLETAARLQALEASARAGSARSALLETDLPPEAWVLRIVGSDAVPARLEALHAALAPRLRALGFVQEPPSGDGWTGWWPRAASPPELSPLFAERLVGRGVGAGLVRGPLQALRAGDSEAPEVILASPAWARADALAREALSGGGGLRISGG